MPENIDMLYNIASDIYFLAIQLTAAICLSVLCRDFSERKRKIWLIGSAYFLVAVVPDYTPLKIGSFETYFIASVVAFAVFIWIDRKNIRTKIFLSATFFGMRWMAFSTVGRLDDILYKAVLKLLEDKLNFCNPDIWKYYYAGFIINSLFEIILCGVILYFLVRLINRVFSEKSGDMEFRELILLLLPSVNGIVVYKIFRVYADIYENEMKVSIYPAHLALEFLWVFCYAVILASIVSTIWLYQNIKKKQAEEKAGLMLKSQMKDMQSHILEVERLYTEIRGVKHDVKNHIEVINSLLAQGKVGEAQEYSKSFSEIVKTFDFPIKTGNPITDVIIREKMDLALNKNIEFTSDFQYPVNMEINAFDVSVILSNALSNAIEAVKAGGFIKVSSFRNKNAYLITVENSFDGILTVDGESGLPETIKSDKKAHGFGLQNIKSVAAKYYGDVLIEQIGNKVTLTVMLLSAL